MTKNFHQTILDRAIQSLERDVEAPATKLVDCLRLLGKWRAHLVQNTVLKESGTRVLGGIFKGMEFIERSAEGCHVPKLLGCYEQPLQAEIKKMLSNNYEVVVNIGSAEGYYAVGLALLLGSNVRIFAYDVAVHARDSCLYLAEKNNVGSQVTVGDLFQPSALEQFSGKRTLVMCDIEGGEKELFSKASSDQLSGNDFIIECHNCFDPTILSELEKILRPTHNLHTITDDGMRLLQHKPSWFVNLSNLDQLIATWEWRSGPTPWLIAVSNGH